MGGYTSDWLLQKQQGSIDNVMCWTCGSIFPSVEQCVLVQCCSTCLVCVPVCMLNKRKVISIDVHCQIQCALHGFDTAATVTRIDFPGVLCKPAVKTSAFATPGRY